MKKILIIFTLIVLLNASFALASSNFISRDRISFKEETDAINCGDVLTSNTVLTSDLTCAGDGLIIGANGVELDCAGHSITYSESEFGYAIYSNGQTNLNIKNCNIIKGDWNGDSLAISLDGADNSVIENNNILIDNSNENYAIQIEGESFIVKYNTININGNHPCGISVTSPSQDNQIIFNEIQISGADSSGIKIWLDSINNEVSNNEVSNADFGIYLYGSGYAPDGTIISNNDLINIQTWDLLIDEDADEVVLENQPIGKYKIVDSNIIIKKTDIGEIWFDERFTVSGNNLDEDVKVEDNSISVDIINKPELNVSGHIVFYEPNTMAFGPSYNPIKDSSICDYPYGGICTDFEYDEGTETFDFDVSEMALEYKIEGTYIPLPWITVDPSSGPVGSNVDVNISWLSGTVGDSFTILFDTYEVETFNYPDVGDARSFIVEIEVPSIPAGEYEVSLEGRTDVRVDDFTITATTAQEPDVEEVIIEKTPKREKVVRKEKVQKTERKVVERIVKSEPVKKATLSSNNRAFYSFYI
ncbi:MAG: right-handed parallel beta-helix repeat-containing protein [Nanoarchaeota archaeon]|nr:right-handed parallel beta-helix repeat-containing protein [Nanoarchaeota archaeon]